jgi:hypothetical protein
MPETTKDLTPVEDVQAAAGHSDPSRTKLYDRRGNNLGRSATMFANKRCECRRASRRLGPGWPHEVGVLRAVPPSRRASAGS